VYPTPGDRVGERGDGEPGLHPGVDGVAHDPVREHVLDLSLVTAYRRVDVWGADLV
jgi:hypothetical protein